MIPLYEPAARPLSTGCRECDAVTSGRCARHATSVYIVPTYVVQPVVIAPEVIQMLGPPKD